MKDSPIVAERPDVVDPVVCQPDLNIYNRITRGPYRSDERLLARVVFNGSTAPISVGWFDMGFSCMMWFLVQFGDVFALSEYESGFQVVAFYKFNIFS